ncbi:hypothetical protein pb186bvf_017962 [Paramecium bursaria]
MIKDQTIEHSCHDKLLICTFNDCRNKIRQLCSQCQNLHQHEQQDSQHLVEISKFWNFISDQIQSKSRPMKYLKQTIQQINHYNLLGIQKELIEELININNMKKELVQQLQDQLNVIIKSQTNSEIIDNRSNSNTQDEQITDCFENEEQKIKYDPIYNFKTLSRLNSSSISNQEQYLTYIDNSESIQFVNIKMKKKDRIFYLKDIIQKQQFNNNSNLLFSGDYDGNLYCFNIKSKLKQLRKIQTKIKFFSDLRVIKDRVIMSSLTDKIIIVYDIISNRIINKVQDTHYVYQTDYDYDKQIIVSCSGNQSIKFFNSNNERLINENDPHVVLFAIQIQLIKKSNLLTRYSDAIKLWEIRYDTKCLVKLGEFKNFDCIYNFYSVCDDQKIVVITKHQLKIIDSNFELIYVTNHDVTSLSSKFLFQLNRCFINSIVSFDKSHFNNGPKLNPDLQIIMNIKFIRNFILIFIKFYAKIKQSVQRIKNQQQLQNFCLQYFSSVNPS